MMSITCFYMFRCENESVCVYVCVSARANVGGSGERKKGGKKVEGRG